MVIVQITNLVGERCGGESGVVGVGAGTSLTLVYQVSVAPALVQYILGDSHPVYKVRVATMSVTSNAWGTVFSDEELYAIAEAAENVAMDDSYKSPAPQQSTSQQSTTQQPRSYDIVLEEYQEHCKMIDDCFSSQPTCDAVWKMFNDAWSKLNELDIELQQAKAAISQ